MLLHIYGSRLWLAAVFLVCGFSNKFFFVKLTFMFIFAKKNLKMEKNLLIELLEDGDKVSLYSPRFDGESYTEFEKFLLEYKDSYPKDVAQIVYRLDIIKRDGADDRHFRYEGAMRDRVMALPSHLETTSLRLYLLNVQSKILILGNGGLKNSATYQENELLNKCVQTLQKIDIVLKQMEKQKIIYISGTKLLGTLSIVIDD